MDTITVMQQEFGGRANYHLMVNSSIGISCAVELLQSTVKNMFGGDTGGE